MSNIELINRIQIEFNMLGVKLEPPSYFNRITPQSQNIIISDMYRELREFRQSQYIENVLFEEANKQIRELCKGSNRKIVILQPQRTHRYSVDELVSMGFVGLYDVVI